MGQPLNKVLSWLEKELKDVNPEACRLEAELLIAFVLGRERAFIYTVDYLSEEEIRKLKFFLSLRRKKVPLAYIIGKKYFYDLELIVKRGILVPREETEILVEVVKSTIEKGNIKEIVEVGVGSGNISISIARQFENIKIYACDVSPIALEVAQKNAKKHGVFNRIQFFLGPFIYPVLHRGLSFDLVVSNPPYIASWEVPYLQDEVKKEPWRAFYGGWDGCEFYREFFKLLKDKKKGMVVLEISPFIYERVLTLLKRSFDNLVVESFKDYLGYNRVIKIKWH